MNIYIMDEFVTEILKMPVTEMLGSMTYVLLLGIGTGMIAGFLLYAICILWNTVKTMINW